MSDRKNKIEDNFRKLFQSISEAQAKQFRAKDKNQKGGV